MEDAYNAISRSINPYIRDYISKDYAGAEVTDKVLLDCSLGVSSDPLEDDVFRKLHDYRQEVTRFEDIKYYPHDDSLRRRLAKWYLDHGVGNGWLSEDNFLLGNGSYDILVGLNILCLTGGRTVLGHAPQFTAYVDSVFCTGSNYKSVPLPESDNYRFDEKAYLAMMTDDIDLFILENPNNPTGQKVPLEQICRIADKARSMSRILIVDEAYAEYLPFEDSSINLVNDCPNIIVTRSFSKGWGMAGVRLGYAVASTGTGLLSHLSKIVLPFGSNGLARALAGSALESDQGRASDPFGTNRIRLQKKRLTDGITELNMLYGKNLRIAETHPATPILMIYRETAESGFDLYGHMLSKGLLTVSCRSYPGLDGRAVRLMLPEEQQMDLLIDLIREVIKDLP